MILKAKERGDGWQLGCYLLQDKNEHVEVHELRNFASDSLPDALREIDAISRGTRAENYLFSMSLNPPANERVEIAVFEEAIEAIERKLNLDGQPRAVVFHEKDGRRHAHVVWSRIDTAEMKAINLAHFKWKLKDISRELFLDNGWKLPRGLMNSRDRDPRSYTREEWEQAKRAKQDPKALKALFQECWAISDGPKAFANALQARGYTLAKGDRGHVAVDFRGEVYSVSKWVGVRAKEARKKLGKVDHLPSVTQAKATIAAGITEMLRGHIAKVEAASQKQLAALAFRRTQLVEKQRKERTDLKSMHERREAKETAERSGRLNRGFRGIWDRITGKHGKQLRENEREASVSMNRDRHEKDLLIGRQLDERRSYHAQAKQIKTAHEKNVEQLHRDVAGYMRTGPGERFTKNDQEKSNTRQQKDRGPTHER
ncbi:MAG: hypothetical protein QM808_17860 [Steroidobacteraceae bacterium]